jgi:large subunit ribosomal protein L9
MKIILKEDVANLGHRDDIVIVKDGYGRNYLIPTGMAILATPSAQKIHQENLKQRAHKEDQLRKQATEIAKMLENKELIIGAKTSSSGKIFGSVNTIQIAEAISKKGFDIDRKNITIHGDAIKEVGVYKATVKVYKDIKVDMEFTVVSE